MKVMTIVGARPQFIKEAMVSHELAKRHDEILVHTGQHFDYNMSEVFFRELDIPHPKYNLGISGGTHGKMTGKMLEKIEEVLMKEYPEIVLVYGDTNSTLAGALAAAKLHIPIAHIEAGARTYCQTNPEEINRVCTDHVAQILLTSTQSAVDNLVKEGIGKRAIFVGNTMFDAFVSYSKKANAMEHELCLLEGGKAYIPSDFYYLTCHREENTLEENNLKEILYAMEDLDSMVIYPVHPRNKERALRIVKKYGLHNTVLVEPVNYLTSLFLINHTKKVITDSGGLQTEAFFARKKCVTVLDFIVWPETMINNRNQLALPSAKDILDKLSTDQVIDEDYKPFGDAHSAVYIVRELERYGRENGICQ